MGSIQQQPQHGDGWRVVRCWLRCDCVTPTVHLLSGTRFHDPPFVEFYMNGLNGLYNTGRLFSPLFAQRPWRRGSITRDRKHLLPAAAAAPGSPQQAVSRLTSPRHVRYALLCKVDTSYLVTRVFMSFSYFQSGLSLVFDWILWSFHAYCFV